MSDPRPPYTPWLTPYVIVTDAELTLGFYAQAFGFQVGNIVRDEEDKLQHVEMYYRDQMVVMFSPEGAYGMESKAPITQGVETPVTFYVYTEDVDEIFQNATEFGGLPIIQPQDMAWGDRMCGIEDPNGYRWLFACAKSEDEADEDDSDDEEIEDEDDTGAKALPNSTDADKTEAAENNAGNNPAFTASSNTVTRTNLLDTPEDTEEVPPPPTMTH
jgi:uncharacterized glyoxalase superfamily protein PhnB